MELIFKRGYLRIDKSEQFISYLEKYRYCYCAAHRMVMEQRLIKPTIRWVWSKMLFHILAVVYRVQQRRRRSVSVAVCSLAPAGWLLAALRVASSPKSERSAGNRDETDTRNNYSANLHTNFEKERLAATAAAAASPPTHPPTLLVPNSCPSKNVNHVVFIPTLFSFIDGARQAWLRESDDIKQSRERVADIRIANDVDAGGSGSDSDSGSGDGSTTCAAGAGFGSMSRSSREDYPDVEFVFLAGSPSSLLERTSRDIKDTRLRKYTLWNEDDLSSFVDAPVGMEKQTPIDPPIL
ncbi:hypothetical protein V1478_008235 [Vespula squamosa]|uniref:Uncharacterized protein n=1 Tax=Vespula squamosa TaxID=30214 RepID=A0ABD2AY84_VESSQ